VLAFRREPDFISVANTTDQEQTLEISGEILLTSSPGAVCINGSLLVPPHTTCWISTQD
jgi:hypothetical protein